MTSYGSSVITAWDLSSCLANGFMTAVIFTDHAAPGHASALIDNTYHCRLENIEVSIMNDFREHVHDIDYVDLARITSLVQKFHHEYMMPQVVFDIEYTGREVSYAKIGFGRIIDLRQSGKANGIAVV